MSTQAASDELLSNIPFWILVIMAWIIWRMSGDLFPTLYEMIRSM
jgi:hypothetical protein